MATKTQVELIDDLTGEPADETVEFGIDGVNYAIDLSEAHAKDLRGELEAYKAAARRVGGRVKQATKVSAGAGRSREQTRAIRDWWRSQGGEIKDRGRVPGHVIEKFDAAH